MKIYLGTNTKMYKTIADTTSYLSALKNLTKDIEPKKIQLFVIPSFTALESGYKVVKDSAIKLGAQNMCWEDQGQFTGEISPLMLQEIGVSIVEIGHSERRHVFGETDEEERKKVEAALRHGFHPLLCIGETKEQKEYGISDEILRIQLKTALHNVTVDELSKVWIAYEPVWAIGVSGIPASAEYVEKRHDSMRRTLTELYGEEGRNVPLLYGGSVNNENAKEFIVLPEVNGLFIGRSAWDAENFNKIIRMIG